MAFCDFGFDVGVIIRGDSGVGVALTYTSPDGEEGYPGTMNVTSTGASPLFWAVSLLTGIALGVIAYVIVLQL